MYRVSERVHSAVGWQLANTILIEGQDGVVIVDVGSFIEPSREILAEFRKITDEPIRAIVYTHFHPDHTNGVRAFADEADLASGRVRIFAHETLMENVTR